MFLIKIVRDIIGKNMPPLKSNVFKNKFVINSKFMESEKESCRRAIALRSNQTVVQLKIGVVFSVGK